VDTGGAYLSGAGTLAFARRRNVTIRRLAAHEAALREGLRLYQTMFERSSLGQLIVDVPSFHIDIVNRAFCAMTGYTVSELVGRHMDLVYPPGQSPIADIVERIASGETEAYSARRLLQRRDGTLFSALSTVSVVRDDEGEPIQLLILLQDRTEERRAEEVQRRSQALIDAAIATLPMTFTAFDCDLRFTYVAGGLSQGGRQDDFLGRSVTDYTTDAPTLQALRRALAGVESTTRTLVKGQTYLTLHGPMCDDAGVVVGVVAVSTNVTTEVTAEAVRKQAEELRLYVANHDPLTGLPGRSALFEHLNRVAHTQGGPGALLLLDLDGFKLINAGLGHEIGDAVLLEVARRLSEAFPGLMVARNGGDDFAVVVAVDTDRSAATAAAQLVHAALDTDLVVGTHRLRVTACVGVAIKHGRGSSSTLIGNADSALSRAKLAGAGEYRLYDTAMRRQVEDHLMIQGGLGRALSGGELHLDYQPIISLVDGQVVGAEALLRWDHPQRGSIPPVEFVPVAEQSGLILPIGQWVLETACADGTPWQQHHGMYMSINVSGRQLLGSDFPAAVNEVLARTGLLPARLVLEVTESVLMDDLRPIRLAFDRLRAAGVRVAVDDFGTGYSSLARLQDLPVDIIKLDRAFVTGLDERRQGSRMARAILQLSEAIGADIVAEGIETEQEAAVLRDLGYRVGQGFLFARPMSGPDLTGWVGANRAVAVSDRC
jgi:diguanylate cyclase (GGDEF)-like protein/PAS domain S-box-containing protein